MKHHKAGRKKKKTEAIWSEMSNYEHWFLKAQECEERGEVILYFGDYTAWQDMCTTIHTSHLSGNSWFAQFNFQ